MRGLRLPELANGDFMKMFSALFDVGVAESIERFLQGLAFGDRRVCLQEFDRGRSSIVFELTIKTTGVMEPPCRLFGLAHFDESAQLLSLEICLNTIASNFPRIVELQSPPLFDQAAAALSGCMSMEECDELADFVAGLQFWLEC